MKTQVYTMSEIGKLLNLRWSCYGFTFVSEDADEKDYIKLSEPKISDNELFDQLLAMC